MRIVCEAGDSTRSIWLRRLLRYSSRGAGYRSPIFVIAYFRLFENNNCGLSKDGIHVNEMPTFTPTGVLAISRWFACKAHHRSDRIECDSILKGSQQLRHAKVAVIPSGSYAAFQRFPGVSLRSNPGYRAAINVVVLLPKWNCQNEYSSRCKRFPLNR